MDTTAKQEAINIIKNPTTLPTIIKETLDLFVSKDRINIKSIHLGKHYLGNIKTIIITGLGSSYYAAKIGAYNLEMLTSIPTYAISSSLLMNARGVLDKDTLVIAISHSGETRETISAIERALYNNAKVVAITDNSDSTVASITKNTILSKCDFEIQENDQLAFQADYFALAMLGIFIGSKSGAIPRLNTSVTLKLASMLSGKLSLTQKDKRELKEAGEAISAFSKVIVAGFGADEGLASQVASHLRCERSINAYALAFSEIQPQDIKDSSTLVIPIITNINDSEYVAKELERISSLNQNMIVFTTSTIMTELDITDGVVTTSDTIPLFNPISLYNSILYL